MTHGSPAACRRSVVQETSRKSCEYVGRYASEGAKSYVCRQYKIAPILCVKSHEYVGGSLLSEPRSPRKGIVSGGDGTPNLACMAGASLPRA